jgi:hypothetical protein
VDDISSIPFVPLYKNDFSVHHLVMFGARLLFAAGRKQQTAEEQKCYQVFAVVFHNQFSGGVEFALLF